MALVLTNTQLIDCVNPTPLPGASVIVEGGGSPKCWTVITLQRLRAMR